MHRLSEVAAAAAILALPPLLWAGPYSSGTANTTLDAPDAGIPGFVGLDGAGVVSDLNYTNPLFVGWATGVTNYTPAVSATQSLDAIWKDPASALGPVKGEYADVVSLGELTAADLAAGRTVGTLVLSFAGGIRNGIGADFAVFENGLGSDSSIFCELAFVEVSSNGTDFARFEAISLLTGPIDAYASVDPTNLYNFAGKHANGNGKSWGTPFDLDQLQANTLVATGKVDLNDIRYMKLVDIPGTGAFTDSLSNAIYDPNPTFGSGGLDLEAVGVINAVPEPTSALVLCGLAGLLARRRRN